MIDEMIKAAKAWRPLARLDVIVEAGGGNDTRSETLRVKLGDARRRWKRIAAQLAGVVLLGARGYDAKDELIGSWDAPAEDDAEELDESDEERGHRQHTQWVIREVAAIYATTQRLTVELVGAAVDLIKSHTRPAPPQPAADDGDEATRVLGQLIGAAMQNHNNNRSSDADEEIRGARSPRSDAEVQGQPDERGQAGEGSEG